MTVNRLTALAKRESLFLGSIISDPVYKDVEILVTTPPNKNLVSYNPDNKPKKYYNLKFPTMLWRFRLRNSKSRNRKLDVHVDEIYMLKSFSLGSDLYCLPLPNMYEGYACLGNFINNGSTFPYNQDKIIPYINHAIASFYANSFNEDDEDWMDNLFSDAYPSLAPNDDGNGVHRWFALWEKSYKNMPWKRHCDWITVKDYIYKDDNFTFEENSFIYDPHPLLNLDKLTLKDLLKKEK